MTDPEPIPADERVIKSYVWHKGACYFVSTIERTSSAMANPCRFNETLVWEFDWAKGERGRLVHQDEDRPGSVAAHVRVCEDLHGFGPGAFKREDAT